MFAGALRGSACGLSCAPGAKVQTCAMVKHLLGQRMCVGGGLNAKVAKHGIRLPSSKELDVVFVATRTWEGSDATWAQRAAAQQVGLNARV